MSLKAERQESLGIIKPLVFLKNYYITEHIKSPLGSNYYQQIPKSFFPENIKASQNVIAYVKGDEFPEEVIIISAHSDHEGNSDTEIYNGADDNGSGTAAIMEIAQAFQKASTDGYRPKRSVVFLHLTGEEIGLYGSKYYTKYPVFSMSNTIANLNIDMIGRVDKTHVNNSNIST